MEPVHYPIPTPAPLPAQRTSTLAIVSLILGLLGFQCCCFTAIPAIITGWLELSDIRRGYSSPNNRGFAIAGIILGILGLFFTLCMVGFQIFGIALQSVASVGR